MVHVFGRVFLSAVCVLGLAQAVAAQETVNYGSISGRVADPQGAAVPGARASVRHRETNFSREALTDNEGRFRFPYLRVGAYEVIVRLSGFADATKNVTVTIGSAFELPVALSMAGLDTSVTVTADATVLEAARSQIAGTVAQGEVQDLPMNGRNFLDLALLIPGVSPTNIGSTQLFAETSAVPGPGVSVGSQRNFSNNFIVDGLSANDDAAGLSGIPYSVDAVDQFQVVTSGGQAELGRALGGYISVVTKSGTNSPHAALYGYVRDRRLNAANALSGTKLPMTQKQYGASAGGPIVRNRTFYFSNFEQRRLNQFGLTTIADANVQAINQRLSGSGYPGSPIATGAYPNPVSTTNFIAKIDHQLNNRGLLGIRYSLYDAVSQNSRGAGALNAPSASSGLDSLDQSVALSSTVTLSSRTVNETRVQFVHGDLQALPSDPTGPAVSIAGVASFGTLSGSPQARVNTLYQVINNLSHQSGAHALRAGVDFVYNDDTITFPRSVRGAYAFSSLANFLSGGYNASGFTQTFGDSAVSQTNPNVGVYVQDEWKAGQVLTINAGLRYDLQFLETIDTDTSNVSPRLGFAWTPAASRRTIVRGSAGLYFDRVPLRALANALLSAGNTTDVSRLRQVNVVLSPTQAGAPVFPNILIAAVPAVTLPSLTTMDRGLQNAYSRQMSVELERQLGSAATVSVGYQYVRGSHLIVQVNQNVPTCAATGDNNGCRPNSAYANNNQYSSIGTSNYHGLHLSFVQRPGTWGHLRVSYSYSKSMNDVGENFFNSPVDPTDISKDWGRSDDDQRHRLVVSGAASLPFRFQLSSALQAYSALPFNITSGLTTVQGTAGRPMVAGNFIERNAGVGSHFFTLSARLSRSFTVSRTLELEGVAEAFNLTNRRNNLTRNTNFGPGAYPSSPLPAFGQITAVGEPRAFQFGARLRF
ncbi:MAG TPA: TonB-dependent receptor [Vicinamibacterales bacterium]|nr:TonB-dependent receptor [Vicinamibacterales bacterium]